jgi:hypothetical protein
MSRAGSKANQPGKAKRPFSAKRITELVTAITQHGLTIPAGYTFDPRADPPLFPAPPPVADELPNGIDMDTGQDGEDGEDDAGGEGDDA